MRSCLKQIMLTVMLVMIVSYFCFAGENGENISHPSGIYVISRIEVNIVGAGKRNSGLKTLARDLIVLKEGKPFSEKAMAESITALKECRLFQNIDIPDPDWTSPNPVLSFFLTPYYRIRDIKINGAFPLLEEKVLGVMNIGCGDIYSPVSLREQEERLRALYQKEGYPHPVIRVTADPNEPEDGVVLYVDIDKGFFYGIKNLIIEGNESVWGFRLKMRTHFYKASFLLGESRRLIKGKLDQDIQNLIHFYRQKGYPEVKINAKAEILEKVKKANILFSIDEGPYYKIVFTGNKAFWDSTLMEDLDFTGRGNPGDITLKRGLRNIRERYRKAGYPDVWLTMNSETATEKRKRIRTVTIDIEEGYQNLVGSLDIQGNLSIPTKEINKEILSQTPGVFDQGVFVSEMLEEDVAAVISLYNRKGFASADVQETHTFAKDDKKKVRKTAIVFRVNEGPKTVIRSIRFPGMSALKEKEALKILGLEKNGPYSEVQLQDDEKKLSEAITEKGYPHVTVKGKVAFSDDKTRADLDFEVNEGILVRMGKTVCLGNFVTSDRILDNEMEQKEGDPFSLLSYLEAQRNIRNINALDKVEFKEFGLRENWDKIDLEISMSEKKTYYIESNLGYDSAQNRYLTMKVGDRNLLGLNKDAYLSYHVSDIGFLTEFGITEPRFLGTRFSSLFKIYTEKLAEKNLSYGTRTNGSSLTLTRDFKNNISTGMNFQYTFKDLYLINLDTPIDNSVLNTYDGRHMFITSPFITYNSTDSFIRPRKGIYSTISVDYSNALGDKADDFMRYNAQTSFYYSPLSFLTFAVKGRYGYLQPIATVPAVPADQLFYLGGAATVRGYDENTLRLDANGNALSGRELLLANVETRIYLGLNLELTTFYDTGAIRKTIEGPDENDAFSSTYGAGLRYITPIGPMGFLYGRKISPRPGESAGKAFFTVGYTF